MAYQGIRDEKRELVKYTVSKLEDIKQHQVLNKFSGMQPSTVSELVSKLLEWKYSEEFLLIYKYNKIGYSLTSLYTKGYSEEFISQVESLTTINVENIKFCASIINGTYKMFTIERLCSRIVDLGLIFEIIHLATLHDRKDITDYISTEYPRLWNIHAYNYGKAKRLILQGNLSELSTDPNLLINEGIWRGIAETDNLMAYQTLDERWKTRMNSAIVHCHSGSKMFEYLFLQHKVRGSTLFENYYFYQRIYIDFFWFFKVLAKVKFTSEELDRIKNSLGSMFEGTECWRYLKGEFKITDPRLGLEIFSEDS